VETTEQQPGEREITTRELRQRMALRGVTVGRLAQEAHLYAPDVSRMLRGTLLIGPTRRRKLEDAIVRLRLDRDQATEPKVPENGPVFRVRSIG
jgi:hypothetical protein